MAVLRCPLDFTISQMNPVLDRVDDLLGSIRWWLHEFKEMLAAISMRLPRRIATARRNQCLLNGEARGKYIDAEYLGPVREYGEDPLPYDERRKIRMMTWIQDF